MRNLGFFAIFLGLFFFAGNASATTYYVDYASGSDANSGTSNTAPWMHVPGMQGCSAVCAATAPKPADSFILKGGVTWPNASFPILWSWSGTSGNPIYIGVDKTWYAGSSWTRPIFDAQDTVIGGTWNMFLHFVTSGVTSVAVDNIEMKGITWNSVPTYGHLAYITTNTASHITLTNLYMHRWTHTGTGGDNLIVVLGDTNSPYAAGSVCDYCIIDGSDGSSDSGVAFYGFPSVTHSVIHDLPNGILTCGHGELGFNHIYNIKTSVDAPTVHENAIETLTPGAGIFYIHDNVIHDMAIGESMMTGNTNETDYIWNNIIYNLAGGNPFHFPQNTGQTVTAIHYWNNTIVPQSGQNCLIQAFASGTVGTLDFQNNHCITTTSAVNGAISIVSTLNINNNVLQTPTQATTQGFTTSETYVYSPSTTNSSTVASGVNLSSNCSGALAGLCRDTGYACIVDATKQVVCPARTAVTRPSGSAAWDKSAYMLVSSASQPAAPLNLTAIVQ